VKDILEAVVDVLSEDPRVTRGMVEGWIKSQTIHRFDDGIIFQSNNELHIHFFNPSWLYVKNRLTPVMREVLKDYEEVYTVTDIPNAQTVLKKFGAIQEDQKFTVTREVFKNVWCK
jgi:predicted GH43/DUF377 family glycosyl hydrolase